MRAVLLACLLFLPAAQALAIDLPQGVGSVILAPDVGTTMKVKVEVNCDQVLDKASLAHSVTHAITTPYAALSATSAGPHLLPANFCVAETSHAYDATFTLNGSMDIPGEVPLKLDHTFEIVDEAGAGLGAARQSTQIVLMAWTGNVTASVDATVKSTGPQKELQYTITVTNHGNSRTVVGWEFVGEQPKVGEVVLPIEVILEAPNTGDGEVSRSVTLSYNAPYENGANDARASFSVRPIATSTKDPSQTAPGEAIALQANTKGLYVPGPAAVLPMALLLAALVRRR